MKWTEALNIAGSIASISGISLLWLHTLMPEVRTPGLIAGSVSTIAGALISVGLITLAAELLTIGAKCRFASDTYNRKIIYWTFTCAIALLVLAFTITIIWAIVLVAWHLQ